MLGMGAGEWAIICGTLVLLFGAEKLPRLGSSVGESIKNFKKGIKSTEKENEKEDEKKEIDNGKKVENR